EKYSASAAIASWDGAEFWFGAGAGCRKARSTTRQVAHRARATSTSAFGRQDHHRMERPDDLCLLSRGGFAGGMFARESCGLSRGGGARCEICAGGIV